MTNPSSLAPSQPGTTLHAWCPGVGGFDQGKNRRVELPNIPALTKLKSRALAKELARFHKMPISEIAKSIRSALGKMKSQPGVITHSSYKFYPRKKECALSILDAFSRGRAHREEHNIIESLKINPEVSTFFEFSDNELESRMTIGPIGSSRVSSDCSVKRLLAIMPLEKILLAEHIYRTKLENPHG